MMQVSNLHFAETTAFMSPYKMRRWHDLPAMDKKLEENKLKSANSVSGDEKRHFFSVY